eukprot:4791879-Prymnesium_polylepis.3
MEGGVRRPPRGGRVVPAQLSAGLVRSRRLTRTGAARSRWESWPTTSGGPPGEGGGVTQGAGGRRLGRARRCDPPRDSNLRTGASPPRLLL